MKSLPIIISGIIVLIFGITFQFQGQGMVGPESSFMYQNPNWIDNGIYIGMVGVITVSYTHLRAHETLRNLV